MEYDAARGSQLFHERCIITDDDSHPRPIVADLRRRDAACSPEQAQKATGPDRTRRFARSIQQDLSHPVLGLEVTK